LLVAVLAGCASHRVWVRPDLTQQRFDQDNYACVQEVNAAGKGGWSFGPLWWVLWQQSAAKSGAKKLYEMCMRARGYELRDASGNATATGAPTAVAFELATSEQKAFFAKQLAEHEHEWDQPRPCGGLGAFPSLNNYVLTLTPWAEDAGLRRGDRITKIGDDPVAALSEVMAALGRVPEGGPVRVVVVRESRTMTFALPCRRQAHQENVAVLKQLFASGAAGEWDTCVASVDRLVVREGVRTAFLASVAYKCKVGQNRSAKKVADLTEAQLLYDSHRLALEEGQFEPDGIAKRRGAALADIAYLRQHGFTSLAADLETLLARASDSRAHANVDAPAIVGRQ
jgi:hypothetical protein